MKALEQARRGWSQLKLLRTNLYELGPNNFLNPPYNALTVLYNLLTI